MAQVAEADARILKQSRLLREEMASKGDGQSGDGGGGSGGGSGAGTPGSKRKPKKGGGGEAHQKDP